MSIKPELVEILVCPLGKSELEVDGDRLRCKRCGPVFSVRDGIPNMLIDDAELPEGCDDVKDLPCVREGDAE